MDTISNQENVIASSVAWQRSLGNGRRDGQIPACAFKQARLSGSNLGQKLPEKPCSHIKQQVLWEPSSPSQAAAQENEAKRGKRCFKSKAKLFPPKSGAGKRCEAWGRGPSFAIGELRLRKRGPMGDTSSNPMRSHFALPVSSSPTSGNAGKRSRSGSSE